MFVYTVSDTYWNPLECAVKSITKVRKGKTISDCHPLRIVSLLGVLLENSGGLNPFVGIQIK